MLAEDHNRGMSVSEHVIRATYSDRTIRVYQAYRREIAIPALAAGRFVPPFSMTRMTWIKPSFNWMMYRSGYATKPGQEVVLGIDITREGLEWALQNAVLSRFSPTVHSSAEEWQNLLTVKPVRIQWDPGTGLALAANSRGKSDSNRTFRRSQQALREPVDRVH
jgi:hypothetical protein